MFSAPADGGYLIFDNIDTCYSSVYVKRAAAESALSPSSSYTRSISEREMLNVDTIYDIKGKKAMPHDLPTSSLPSLLSSCFLKSHRLYWHNANNKQADARTS